MKVLAINGSHRKGKNTAQMLKIVLEETARAGAQTELLEVADLLIKPCLSCNRCLRRNACSIDDDDMGKAAEKMLAADAIVLGSPVYFSNVTGLMKIFIDRTRWLHMAKNMLHGKIGAAVTFAGLRNGGQEVTLQIMQSYLMSQGLMVVDSRNPQDGIISSYACGSMFAGMKEGQPVWRSGILEDEAAVLSCRQMGRNIVEALGAKGL
jgi:multimeric flavodoxin WrbA